MTRALDFEDSDREPFDPGYDKGGVPWFLLLLYLCFLTFFTWYVLEYQLPDFLREGPAAAEGAAESR